MKTQMMMLISAPLFLCLLPAAQGTPYVPSANDKTITRVVKLLQSMLETSKDEGNTEQVLYAKYKCYCDTNEDAKRKEVSDLEEEIALLENSIAKILADNAIYSQTLAEMKAKKAENVQARGTATSVRNNENALYTAERADLIKAITACNASIIELATVGADQSLATGADHTQYMSGEMRSSTGMGLSQLKSNIKQALIAASAMTNHKQESTVQSFLQAPFTGTYTSQAGEVFGIIKDMRDTFLLNVADLDDVETKALAAYNKYIANKLREHGLPGGFVKIETDARNDLGANLMDLSTKTSSLGASKLALKNANDFLDSLIDMCDTKAKEYQHRVMLRTNEEAAIAQAISILNSDAAFATFDTVDATSTGATGLIQLRSIHKHVQKIRDSESDPAAKRASVTQYLRGKAAKTHSNLLSKIVAFLEVENPFDTVLEKIGEMIDIIEEEEKVDDEHFTWCNDERTNTDGSITSKNTQINTLNGQIGILNTAINDPVIGLKKKIADTEANLEQNQDDQISQTQTRKEEEEAYRKDISNLVDAEQLLDKAITVLEKYYSDAEGTFQTGATKYTLLLQNPTLAPPTVAPPTTWASGGYTGQNAEATTGGNSAVEMLKYIQTQTKTEETTAHNGELTAQHAYEDEMKRLTDSEATYRTDLATYGEQLALKEKELMEKQKDLAAVKKEKRKLEAYLVSIKPGCDFITDNIDLRKSNRDEETTALNTAVTMIKGSPVYKTAIAQLHNETLGDCLDFCAGSDEDTAKCQACLAKVTVPAYCAGHPQTTGC